MAQTKMLYVATAVVFFGLVLPYCSALECYDCDMCENDERGYRRECPSGQDVCMKVALHGISVKKCSYRSLCEDGDVEVGYSAVVGNRFRDGLNEVIGAEKGSSLREVLHCCNSNYCNAASAMIPATALLLLVSLVVGLLME